MKVQDRKTKLEVALLQADLIWESPQANREHFDQRISELAPGTDLIILPEMFTTGFTMQPQNGAEAMDGPTIGWMKNWANQTGAALLGSLVITSNNTFYNRFVFVTPTGRVETYDKRHTFTLAGEHLAYTAGKEAGIVTYKGWRICLRICYDLRFPVWSRNQSAYDLLIFVANWPQPRIRAWDTLLQARAIENMAFCIGVNRTGSDPNGHQYPGHSAVYNGLGDSISSPVKGDAQTFRAVLDLLELQALRKQLPFLEDRDEFDLH